MAWQEDKKLRKSKVIVANREDKDGVQEGERRKGKSEGRMSTN